MRQHLPPVIADIADNDEMLRYAARTQRDRALARAEYFRQGAEISATVEQILAWRRIAGRRVEKVLDFASGHGRVTRFLLRHLSADRLWVSDIAAEAVAFQTRTFDVNGFVSCSDPKDLACGLSFDAIFVGSLFTHLPAERFRQWLKKLADILERDGVLAFSVHGDTLSPQAMPNSGILFAPKSESSRLAPHEYGRTIVTEAFVRSAIDATLGPGSGPGRHYRRLPRAMCGEHDLYLVSRDGEETFDSLVYREPPFGCVDHFKILNGETIVIEGWACEPDADHTIARVEIRLEGELAAYTAPGQDRDDVAQAYQTERFRRSGWSCAFPLADFTAGAALEVAAVSSSGVSRTLLFYPLPAGGESRDVTVQVQPVTEPEYTRGSFRRLLKRCAASLAYRLRAMTGGA